MKNRREFLKFIGCLGALGISYPIIKKLIASNLEPTIGQFETDKIYLFIQNQGAPARWLYDLFLDPYSTGKIIANKSVITKFVEKNGRYLEGEYFTENVLGIQVPPIWQSRVKDVNGKYRYLHELLNNMYIVQGGSSNSLSHEDSSTWQSRPSDAEYSLQGIISAHQKSFLPSVAIDTKFFDYFSPFGDDLINVTALKQRDILELFLKPLSCKGLSQLAIEDIQTSLGPRSPYYSLAKEKIMSCFENIDEIWLHSVSKYKTLITNSLNEEVGGINDKPIGSLSDRDKKYELYGGQRIHNQDVRSLVDYRSFPVGMAEHFAVAEVLIKNKLSQCVSINPPTFSDLNFQISKNREKRLEFFHDQHPTGSIPTLFLNALYFRALSSCLMELIDVLKQTPEKGKSNLFDKTIIHLGSEFNRSPRVDASGSDHGYNALSFTVISGLIKDGPGVWGRMYNRPEKGFEFYDGTWGCGAPLKEIGNRQFNHSDIVATISNLFGVKSPSPSGVPLLTISSDKIQSNISKATLDERPN